MARLRVVSKNEDASHISLKENRHIAKYKLARKMNFLLVAIIIIQMGLLFYAKHH